MFVQSELCLEEFVRGAVVEHDPRVLITAGLTQRLIQVFARARGEDGRIVFGVDDFLRQPSIPGVGKRRRVALMRRSCLRVGLHVWRDTLCKEDPHGVCGGY